MKLIHLSDLHLGKRVNEFSMLEDQQYILEEILRIIDSEKPDGVLIAGDVYDKTVPSAEAVTLLDEFLVQLSKRDTQTFLISGNHDSAERLAFGGRLMEQSGIHIARVYNGVLAPLTLHDEYGPVDLYLLPFLRPVQVRRFFPESEIATYTEAMAAVLGAADIDKTHHNVLVTHQFVTGAQTCDSEELSVGGTDNVDVSVFDDFDYVALGHIHGPQKIGRETVRYCGTPLKYSFSEVGHKKSVTVVELAEKGSVAIRTVPLVPKRDMSELRGAYNELMLRENYEGKPFRNDYLRITLTDEEDIPNAVNNLRTVYPYIMRLDYDNRRTRTESHVDGAEQVERKRPLTLFEEFYESQNGQPMSEEQRSFAKQLMERIWEGKE
mgnify:FL=1